MTIVFDEYRKSFGDDVDVNIPEVRDQFFLACNDLSMKINEHLDLSPELEKAFETRMKWVRTLKQEGRRALNSEVESSKSFMLELVDRLEDHSRNPELPVSRPSSLANKYSALRGMLDFDVEQPRLRQDFYDACQYITIGLFESLDDQKLVQAAERRLKLVQSLSLEEVSLDVPGYKVKQLKFFMLEFVDMLEKGEANNPQL